MQGRWQEKFEDDNLLTLGDGKSGAVFDNRRRYRYALWRDWDEDRPTLCFIMLNPSTADHLRLDPTITRCFNLAKRKRYGSLLIMNLFAWRSTDAKLLYRTKDPIGKHNDTFIDIAIEHSETIVLAWGNHGSLLNRHAAVLSRLETAGPVFCLAVTKQGHPRHPLYLRRDVALKPFLTLNR